MDKTTQIVFIVFTAIIAVSFLVQALALLAVFLAARKAQKKIHALAEDIRIHVLPAVNASRGVIEDLSPKIKIIASNLTDSSNKVRDMANDISGAVGDVAGRTRAQAAHVDGMVQGTLDRIAYAGQSLEHGFSVPFRQLNGIVNGLRAGWNVLCQRRPPTPSEKESDLFI